VRAIDGHWEVTASNDMSQLRADSWSNELVVRETPAAKDVSTEAEDTVENRYQVTTREDITKWYDSVCSSEKYVN
jgi:hypothetical protein